MKMIIWISVIYFFSFILSLSDITHSILPTYVPVNSKGTYPSCRPLKKNCQIPTYRWFSRYVIGAMLVDENKRFLISSFCSSTSNCALQHCLQTTYMGELRNQMPYSQGTEKLLSNSPLPGNASCVRIHEHITKSFRNETF